MLIIEKEKCIGCGLCVTDCLRRVLELEENKAVIKSDNCFRCGHCYCICPTGAVSLNDKNMDGAEEVSMKAGKLDPEKLLTAIKSRRSVRQFTDQAVETEKLQRIIDAARFTPTAANLQRTEYIVVQNDLKNFTRECMEELKFAAEHPDIADTPMLPRYTDKWIDLERCYREEGIDRLFYHADAVLLLLGSREMYPTGIIDAGLAASNAEMMSFAEGLGCVYVGFVQYAANTPKLRARLNIPDTHEVVCCLAIGYPAVDFKRTAPRKIKKVNYL